jgi:uncharacterized protein YdaU (DUF1376 family)
MNENHWYPREPMTFLTDTLWCDAATEVAHNRLTDTYYAIGRPINDNDEEICLIGKIKAADYRRVRGNLERLGWRFEEGVLRHRRVEETMASMDSKRQRRSGAGRTGAQARWQTHGKRNADAMRTQWQTQCGRNGKRNADAMANPMANPMPNAWQNDASNSNSTEIHGGVELPSGFPATVAEANVAAMFVGCTDEFAAVTWNKAMSRGGMDAKGQPIRSWRHYLATEWAYENNRREEKKQSGKRSKTGSDRNEGTLNAEASAADIQSKVR